jgi:hypothetical protein
VGGSRRYSVSLTKGVVVGEFRVEKLVLDLFFLSSAYRLIPVGAGGRDSVVDSGLQRISLISFLRNPIVS